MNAECLLETETQELLGFLRHVDCSAPEAYGAIETRLDYFKSVTQTIERQLEGNIDELRRLQQWFREKTDEVFLQSRLMKRVRTWPEGYPGDYVTLELVYANSSTGRGKGIGPQLDKYFLTRTLAVAVRSRLRRLAHLLNQRAGSERKPAVWLNLACGPCRELLSVSGKEDRTVWCVDRDPNAVSYAQSLLSNAGRNGDGFRFLKENAFRFGNADVNSDRFGKLTTIYSAGLFDYIPTRQLSKLIGGLYRSLAPGGVLIAPFKDKHRYDTFDYHWIGKWDFFFQRSEDDFRTLMIEAGIPSQKLEMERDDSGVIMFFIARR
jgi:SAM-dependent methyltransferase